MASITSSGLPSSSSLRHSAVHLTKFVFILPEACFGNVPVMFPRMIQINNLCRSVKLLIRNIPYPGGAISDHNSLPRRVHAAPHCLLIHPPAKHIPAWLPCSWPGRLHLYPVCPRSLSSPQAPRVPYTHIHPGNRLDRNNLV